MNEPLHGKLLWTAVTVASDSFHRSTRALESSLAFSENSLG